MSLVACHSTYAVYQKLKCSLGLSDVMTFLLQQECLAAYLEELEWSVSNLLRVFLLQICMLSVELLVLYIMKCICPV